LLAASAQKTGANIRRGQRGFVDLAQASGMMFAPLPAMPVADAASPAGIFYLFNKVLPHCLFHQ
jgi:hypothetical protein